MARHDQVEIAKMIAGLADSIAAAFDPKRPITVVGIRTRGEVLAQRLVKLLGERGFAHIGRGVLDITLYRDDLSEVGPRPLVRPTKLDIAIDAVPLLLVDDVLFTGRSARAALEALSDFGRPSVVRLAVLVDRGGRELPIQPDFLALKMTNVAAGQRVKVRLSEVDDVDEIIVALK